MTLQVPFEDLASTAGRFGIKELYMETLGAWRVLTGFSPKDSVLVASRTDKPEKEIKEALSKSGCEVHRGSWSDKPLDEDVADGLFVAAVGYQSGTHTPGVWVDAFKEEPTHVQVLEAIYTEFRNTGEMADITIEEFIKGANPTVVVTSRSQLNGFIDAKSIVPCD